MTIVSYVDEYNELKNQVKLFKGEYFIDKLFIDITDLMNIKKITDFVRITDDRFSILDYMTRDTIIYNLHKNSKTETKRIFVYMLSKILSKSADTTSAMEMYHYPKNVNSIDIYSKKLLTNLEFIQNEYTKLIEKYVGTINSIYDEIVNKYNKISSFVRVGRRSVYSNPRYIINPNSYTDGYLKLDYINIDEKNHELDSQKKSDNLEKYIFGKFDKIYDPDKNNGQISQHFFSNYLWNETTKTLKNNICVIGLGQSGSGKTSSLISFKNIQEGTIEDGILISVLKNHIFQKTYSKIKLIITEITLKLGETPTKIEDILVKNSYTTTDVCKSIEYVLKGRNWELQNQEGIVFLSPEEKEASRDIGQYIVYVMEKRRLIDPTPNNPVSSRSHMVICMTCSSNTNPSIEEKSIIFLDLAGNENEFECDKQDVIMEFYNKYRLESKINKSSDKLEKIFNKEEQPNCPIDMRSTDKTNSTLEDHIKELTNQLKPLSDLRDKIEFIAKIKNFFENTNVIFAQKSIELPEFLLTRKMIYAATFSGTSVTPATTKKVPNTINKAPNPNQNPNQNPKLYEDILTNIIALDGHWQDINKTGKITKTYNKILVDDNINPKDTKIDNEINTTNYLKIKCNRDGRISREGAFDIFYKFLILLMPTLNLTVSNLETETLNFVNLKEVILKEIQAQETKIRCEKQRLKAIEHECDERKREGFMINRSIKDLIEEIKSLTSVSLKRVDTESNSKYMPLCFETQIAEGCLVPLKHQEIYETFYIDTNIEEPDETSSIILKTIQGKNVNLQELNFVVFTVLNITDDDKTNNPPNPPFININDIIYIRNIVEEKDHAKITTEYDKVREKLKGYKYYYKEGKYISKIVQIDDKTSVISKADALIKFISNVNQTTLIGTLESSDKLKHYIFDDVPCLITENTDTPSTQVAGGKRQFIEDRNHMIDQNRRHVSTRRKQLKGSKLTRKSKKEYRYS